MNQIRTECRTINLALAIFGLLLLSVLFFIYWPGSQFHCAIQSRTSDKVETFKVEIADNWFERNKGLQDRNYLDENAGLLFLYTNSEIRTFWMKDTHIPLDIIFINDNKVVHIARNVTPMSKAPISSVYPADKVLEVNAGKASGFGPLSSISLSSDNFDLEH